LFRLTYTSNSLLTDDAEERRNVADILLTSRRNNEEAGVTAGLLATEERFAQMLEGERRAVEATRESPGIRGTRKSSC
jgi:hypothetical protein